jgi:membrane-associated protease RseP (regulator of RpoE activity)
VPEPISLRSRPYAGDPYPGYSPAQPAAVQRRGPGIHVLLFIATFLTTAMASALHQGIDVMSEPSGLLVGLPYAAAIMAILLFHEFGHYFLARLHRVDATLPFFIPAPPLIFFIGTLGAFIRMRSLPRDRRALFDVGAAGPWAGMVVAVPALILGLSLSEVKPAGPSGEAGLFLGDSLLFQAISWLTLGTVGDDVTILLHPIALAGWVGLLVTALNLLPVGQLDGGHVVYAAFGERWHRWISRGTLTTLVILGVSGAATWLVWAVLLSFLGMRHPRLQDPDTPLDRRRKWAAVATLVMFLLTFMPEPVYFSEPELEIPRDEHALPVHTPTKPFAERLIPL